MTPALLAPKIAFSHPPGFKNQNVDKDVIIEMDDRAGIVSETFVTPGTDAAAEADSDSDTFYLHKYMKQSDVPLALEAVPAASPAQRFLEAFRRDGGARRESAEETFSYAALKSAPGFDGAMNALTARELEDVLRQPGFRTADFARYLVDEDVFHKRLAGDADLYFLKKALLKTVKALAKDGVLTKEQAAELGQKFKDPGFSYFDIVTAELLLCYALGPEVQYAARLAASRLSDVPGFREAGEVLFHFPTNPLMWAGYVMGGLIVSLIIGGFSETFKNSPWIMPLLRAAQDATGGRVSSFLHGIREYVARPRPEFIQPQGLSWQSAVEFAKTKYRYLRLHWGGVAVEREYAGDYTGEYRPVTWAKKNFAWMKNIPGFGHFLKSVSQALPDTKGETKAYNNNLFATNVSAMVIFTAIQMSVNALSVPDYDPTARDFSKELLLTAANAFVGWAIGCIGNLYIGLNGKSEHQVVFYRQIYSVAQTLLILSVMIPEIHPVLQQALVALGGVTLLYGVTMLMPAKGGDADAQEALPTEPTVV